MANAVDIMFPSAIHLYCCQHITDNCQQRFGNKVRPLFWQITRAKTPALFKEKMLKLRGTSILAFNYLCNIDRALQTRAYRQGPCFGHDTSNIVESLNLAFNNFRFLPLLQLVDVIYHYVMRIVFERYHFAEKQKNNSLVDVQQAKLHSRLQVSRRYSVLPSGNSIFQVEEPDSGRKWIVDLDKKECDCIDFQEYQGPCSHGIAAALYIERDPALLCYPRFGVVWYKSTYKRFLLPLSI